jgi:two-component system sensor histidine kinase/response regulator
LRLEVVHNFWAVRSELPQLDRPLRILAVDDSDEALELCRRCLESAGHQVATATNGHEALAQLLGKEPPDVIVLDLLMPVMDGWELLRVLRSYIRFSDVPVVVLSAHQLNHEVDEMTRFVGKPFRDETLLAVADEVVQARSRR